MDDNNSTKYTEDIKLSFEVCIIIVILFILICWCICRWLNYRYHDQNDRILESDGPNTQNQSRGRHRWERDRIDRINRIDRGDQPILQEHQVILSQDNISIDDIIINAINNRRTINLVPSVVDIQCTLQVLKETDITILGKECNICFEEYKNDDVIRRLPCMHYFHIDCIDQWFNIKTNCPLCHININ